jgi:hypothetical protein
MDTFTNNISQAAAVRTVISQNYIKKTYNLPQKDIATFQKQISQDDKSTLVSEQQEKYANTVLNNYQYQNNVPLSLLSSTSQPYNETAKTVPTEERSSEADEVDATDYTVEEINDSSQKPGLGYYIIDKDMDTSSSKTAQKISNPMKERLNKIYNLNFSLEPGSIVNVTCY